MSDRMPMDCATARDQAPWFVLGALDAATTAAIREHLATCTEPHPEFGDLGGVVPYLAELPEPVEPPASLRGRILAAAEADVRARRRDEAAAERLVSTIGMARGAEPSAPAIAPDQVRAEPGGAAPVMLEGVRASRAETRRTWRGWVLQAAAVLVIVALGAWNVVLQGDAASARQRADELRGLIAAAVASGAQTAHLAGQPAAPGAVGLAVFPSGGGGYLLVQGLSPAPAGRTYEAWYIEGNTPRRAGTFDVGSDGLAILSGLRANGPVEVVAVTQEPVGGLDQPTGQLLVAGKVGS